MKDWAEAHEKGVDIRAMADQQWVKDQAAKSNGKVIPLNSGPILHRIGELSDDVVGEVNISATPYRWIDPGSIPRREWLHGRHLIRKFISATIAAGGIGKSSLVLVESLEMVTGFTLLSRAQSRQRLRVWYWNGEDPHEETQRRVQAACIHYKINADDLGGRFFTSSGRHTPIIIATESKGILKIATPVVDAVRRTIEENKIDVLRIDPFVRCHRVSENDNGKINAVAEAWAGIADATGSAIELIHHIRKNNSGEVSADDARGAVALTDAARSVRVLNRMSEKEADDAEVDNRMPYFRINDGKSNLAPPAEAATWCKLESVCLGNDDGATPADMVGVATHWKWPDPLEGVTLDDLREVQQKLSTKDYRSDARAKEWAGNMIAEVLGWDASSAPVRKNLKSIINKWRTTGAIVEASGKDEQRKPRKFLRKGEPV
jgi:hypothetical protein